MSNRDKPGRNEPCWCGSGIKFKKCHRDREQEQPLFFGELESVLRRSCAQKQCLHPEASARVCTRIIDAHTVQRAKTLEALLDSTNHVLSFYPLVRDQLDRPAPQKIGWRRASTFTGFCAHHDSITFAPIEQVAFRFTPETAFLLSYRALCHEYYQKMGSERGRIQLQPLLDRGTTPEAQRKLQHRMSLELAGVRRAIENLRHVKRLADADLRAKNYGAWAFACLRFDGPLCFATSGASTPNQDLQGAILQTLHDFEAPLEHLYVSVIADQNSPRVVLGWRREHKAPHKFVASLLATTSPLLPAYFVQYVFAHLENVYFSENWWKSLSIYDQATICQLAGNANAYYFAPAYTAAPTVPWSLASVERFNEAP